MHTQTENLIIGAGPAGLAMAGRFHKLKIPYTLIEQNDSLVSSWRQHYDRVHLHTVKEYSHLPYAPFSDDFPRYIPRKQLIAYYDQYAKEREIKPVFGQKVTKVSKNGNVWETNTEAGDSWISDNIIFATGFNRVPNEPTWPGMDAFTGLLQHSRWYKNGAELKGKRVLVVGMGNTGAEIAIDLHEHGAIPFISVRGPVNIVLRDLNGRPTQTTAMLLQKLPTWLGDWIGTQVSKLTVGNLSAYGIDRPNIPPAKQLRLYGKTPVIDVGTISLIKEGKIKVYRGIDHFDGEEIVFTDGKRSAFDAVILATGYHNKIEDLLEDNSHIFNDLGVPAKLWYEEYPGLYFCGFDAYSSGLLLSILRDSEKIAFQINQHRKQASAKPEKT